MANGLISVLNIARAW